MTIDHPQLQDLEDLGRHRGTGIRREDILGCWQLTTIWPKDAIKAMPSMVGFCAALEPVWTFRQAATPIFSCAMR